MRVILGVNGRDVSRRDGPRDVHERYGDPGGSRSPTDLCNVPSSLEVGEVRRDKF